MFYRFQPPRIPAYMEAISLMAPLGCMRWVVSSFFFEARPASDALLRREETKRNRCWSNLDDLWRAARLGSIQRSRKGGASPMRPFSNLYAAQRDAHFPEFIFITERLPSLGSVLVAISFGLKWFRFVDR